MEEIVIKIQIQYAKHTYSMQNELLTEIYILFKYINAKLYKYKARALYEILSYFNGHHCSWYPLAKVTL